MKEIPVKELKLNPWQFFGKDWALLCAGSEQNGANAMTIAWGEMGALWSNKDSARRGILPVVTVYVRPQRYTKRFMDSEELFTVCAFDEGYKKALSYMGSHSGREEDKAANAGLTTAFGEGTSYFEEAKAVLVCRKLYNSPIKEEGFADKGIIESNYPDKDFHEMYIGEILKVLVKE